MPETPSHNPLTVGLSRTLLPQPSSLVIFGGTGDLAHRKLLPAVYNLYLDGVLPANFCVIGTARKEQTDEDFREFARGGVERFSRQALDASRWSDFERRLFYVPGSFTDPAAHAALRSRLEEIEPKLGVPGNRVFYLAIPPSGIRGCVQQLKAASLVTDPDGSGPFSRVIVEKPIGRDLESAKEINATLSCGFDERQIFRIDHYLGKETVQNIMVLRFANSLFEPLWNQNHIDHVQITVAEGEGVGTRAGYYEEAGALRDMIQNHLLQLVCLTAMEPPWALTADVVRDHKLEVLDCLRPITPKQIEQHVVRAQYGPGFYRGEEVPGYGREEGVKPDSTTETYVALKLFIDNWRWSGVPFYIRTGKRMPKRASEIAVQFKDVPPILFNSDPAAPLEPNVLALRIQPDEGLSLRISTKLPGAKVRIFPVKMDFQYGSTFGQESPEAYERLLLDVMAGDATLFMRRDAVETSWMWIGNIIEAWERSGTRGLPKYQAGTWGPVEGDHLIQRDHREWRKL